MLNNDHTPSSSDQMLTLDTTPKPSQRRRTGQIARLPKVVRDKLNEMIQDGVPYLKIIENLGPDGEGLTEDKLSKWKNSGYNDWLEECRLTDAMRARYELACKLVSEAGDTPHASRALLQTMAANLCYMLSDTDPAALRESLLSDSDKFSRFVHAMVRLSEGSIKCEEHKAKEEDRQEQKAKAARRESPGVSEETLRLAEEKLRLM